MFKSIVGWVKGKVAAVLLKRAMDEALRKRAEEIAKQGQ